MKKLNQTRWEVFTKDGKRCYKSQVFLTESAAWDLILKNLENEEPCVLEELISKFVVINMGDV